MLKAWPMACAMSWAYGRTVYSYTSYKISAPLLTPSRHLKVSKLKTLCYMFWRGCGSWLLTSSEWKTWHNIL